MIQFSLVSKTIWDFEIHFIQLLEFNNYVRQKITIFLDHNFPFYQNQEFLFCWLAWYYLVKKIVFFRYFSIKTNKSIVTDFVITNTCSPRHISEWLICTPRRFAAICNYRSSKFSLQIIASVEMTYPFSVSIRDATWYTPDFFFFS